MAARIVESVESHVFSWSLSRFLKLLESESGVGVWFSKMLESESGFQKCWSRSLVFKNAGVGVGFLKLLESES